MILLITKVRLKNWRSHLDSELSFSEGTNALIGIMGSGKSSVMDAICFALFGTFPNLQSKKLKLDDLIMKKPSEKDIAEVEATFQLNGSTYSVKRIIEKGKGTTYSEIREDGKLLDSPNSQRVTEALSQILKINYDLFSKAIYSEQNALDYFLTIGKGQRMKKIDELLMINKFEIARSNATTLINRLADRKAGKESIVKQVDLSDLEKNILKFREELRNVASEKISLISELDHASYQKSKTEQELSVLRQINQQLESLKRDEKGISSALEEVSISLESLKKTVQSSQSSGIAEEMSSLKEKLEELTSDLQENRKKYDVLYSLLSKSKVNLEFLKSEKISKLEKEIQSILEIKKEYDHLKVDFGEDVDKNLERKRKEFEKSISEVESMKSKIQNIEETIFQLSHVEGVCPICESKLTEERKKLLITQKELQIKDFQEKLDKLLRRREIDEEDVKKLEEASRRLTEISASIRDFRSKVEELENSRKLFSEESEKALRLENQTSEIKNLVDRLEKEARENENRKYSLELTSIQIHDYEEKRKRFGQLVGERENLERIIKEVSDKLQGRDLISMENDMRDIAAKEREFQAKISGLDSLAREKESRLNEYESKLKDMDKQKLEIVKFENLIKDLMIFEKSLELTQIELRREFIEAVNYTMGQIWQTLYPYQDFVSIRLYVEEGDYVLQLQERSGRWINVEGVASGGERSLAALALRIAFALVLAPQLRWLVLDEPTHNLDVKAVEDLALTLRERIGEFVEQVFLITHEEKLENAVTGNLYKLEREKEKDGVTKVITM